MSTNAISTTNPILIPPASNLGKRNHTKIEEIEQVADQNLNPSKRLRSGNMIVPVPKKGSMQEEKLAEIPHPFSLDDPRFKKLPSLDDMTPAQLRHVEELLMEKVKVISCLRKVPVKNLLSLGMVQTFRSHVKFEEVLTAWYNSLAVKPNGLVLGDVYKALMTLKPRFSQIINDFRRSEKFDDDQPAHYIKLEDFDLNDPDLLLTERVDKVAQDPVKLEIFKREVMQKANRSTLLQELPEEFVWRVCSVGVKENFSCQVKLEEFVKACFDKTAAIPKKSLESIARIAKDIEKVRVFARDFADPRRNLERTDRWGNIVGYRPKGLH